MITVDPSDSRIRQAYDRRQTEDIVKKLLENYIIRQVPLASGIVLPENTPLSDVLDSMREKKTGCVVTSKNSKITGIFTERDLLNKVINEAVDWKSPIIKFVTPNPATMKADEPLRKALYLMRKKNFRHIPIFEEDGSLLGVLSVRNVIKLTAEHFPAEVMNLPPKLHHHPRKPEGG